jgi:hypothetical protein
VKASSPVVIGPDTQRPHLGTVEFTIRGIARRSNKLTPTQAQTVIAAAILRHLHAVITTGRAWDPVIATHGTRGKKETTLAA